MPQDKNVKITIMKNDNSLVEFLAETDFDNHADIYTEIPIDENSEFIDADEFEENYFFYSTSLGCLLEKYKSVSISQIPKKKITFNQNKMDRFLKTAELKELEKKVSQGEITYSKMVEEINLKAYVYYNSLKSDNFDIRNSGEK